MNKFFWICAAMALASSCGASGSSTVKHSSSHLTAPFKKDDQRKKSGCDEMKRVQCISKSHTAFGKRHRTISSIHSCGC